MQKNTTKIKKNTENIQKNQLKNRKMKKVSKGFLKNMLLLLLIAGNTGNHCRNYRPQQDENSQITDSTLLEETSPHNLNLNQWGGHRRHYGIKNHSVAYLEGKKYKIYLSPPHGPQIKEEIN